MDASQALGTVKAKSTTLQTICKILNVIGIINIALAILCFFIGLILLSDDLSRYSYLVAFSGMVSIFFGEIGKAIDDIRNHTIADFNLRYNLAEPVQGSFAAAPAPQATPNGMQQPVTRGFKVGDKVVHIKDGKILTVKGVKGNRIICEAGFFSGLSTYNAEELTHYSGN